MTGSEESVYISCVEEVRYSFVSHLSEALRRKGINDLFVDSDDLLSEEAQSKVERARVSVLVLPGNRPVFLDKLDKVLKCQKNKDQVVVPVLYGVSTLQNHWLDALDLRGLTPLHLSRNDCTDSELVKEITRDFDEKLLYMERIEINSKLLEIQNMVFKQPLGVHCVGIWGMPGIGKTTLAKALFNQMSGDFDVYCFIEDCDRVIREKGLYRLLEEQFSKKKPGAGVSITKLSLLSNKLNNKKVLVVLDDVRNHLIAEPLLGGTDWFGPESLIIITSRDKQVFRLCQVNHVYEVQGLNQKEAIQLFLLSASIKDKEAQNLHHELSMKVIEHANGNPLALSIYGRELKGKKTLSEMETAFLELKQRPPYKIVDAFKSSYDTLNDSEKNIFLDIACFFNGENVDYVMQLLEGCGFFPHVGIDVLVGKSLVTVSDNRVWVHNLVQDFGRKVINEERVQIERHSRLWEPWSIKDVLEDDEHKANVEPKSTIKRAQGTEEIQGIFLDTLNVRFDVKPTAFENMLNLRLLKIYCSNPEIRPVINFPTGSLHSLPNELRLLHWENYPAKDLPQKFDPRHLVEINMPYSQLETLWGGTKNLEMLRTIRLCHSQKLENIDELLKAKKLEVIDLQGCTRLQNFPATGQLLHLRDVNLSGCTEMRNFPDVPPNIETLHLKGTGIRKLPTVKPNGGELVSLLEGLHGLSDALKLERLKSLMKSSSSCQDLGKLICLELKDCSCLQSLPNMVNLELLTVLDLSGCSELETVEGFPRNLKELNLAGTAVREVPQLPQSLELLNLHGSRLQSLPNMVNLELLTVLDLSGCSELKTIKGFSRNLNELNLAGTAVRKVPQLPQSLELLNAHGCVSLKAIRLDSKKLPMHYTFSNCFDLSPYMVRKFLVEVLANAKHIPRERQQCLILPPSHVNLISYLTYFSSLQQELNKAPTFSFCAPSHVDQNSRLGLQPGSSIMTRLNPSWRNTIVGFAMLMEVEFSEDYCDVTGLGICCVCRWKNKEGHSQRIERNLQCWAPGKAVPKVEKDHMFVFVDVNMHPSTAEGNDPNISADLLVFEFFPIDKQNNSLEDRCEVIRCGVRVITSATGNTSLEDISPALSLDPMEVSGNDDEEVLRASYHGLQEMNKALFLYIACLFNDEDVNLVAPFIAGIELDVGLKVLADRSLISVSSNGEIVMHCLLRQMGKELLLSESMLPGSSNKIERLVDNSQSSMINARKIDITHSENPEYWTRDHPSYVPTITHSENPETWTRDPSYVPTTRSMAETLLSFSVQKLWELFVRESDRLRGVDEQLTELESYLDKLRYFLKDADAKQHTHSGVRNCVDEIKEIVFDTEDMIETFLLKEKLSKISGIKRKCLSLRRHIIITMDRKEFALDIRGISTRISKLICDMQSFGVQMMIGNDSEYSHPLQEILMTTRKTFAGYSENDIMGLEVNVKKLVGYLVGEDDIQVVSITGMGGIGKTTLARKIFNHEMVKSHFDGVVWVFLSQEFTRKYVWQTILQKLSLKGDENKESNMTEDELQDKLFQLLETRKSLIILDDMWKEDDWDIIKHVFPSKKGWKVLITSRNDRVGLRADPTCVTFKPELLTIEESWTLFQMTAFPRKDIAEYKVDLEMEEMGKKMIKHCEGLPLAIKVLGGLLAAQHTMHDWKRVLENIESHIGGGTSLSDRNFSSVYHILCLSFEELPIYLKHCFLYLAHFPKDHSIDVENLSYYLAAEGISRARCYDGETIRDVAEGYIEELVSRNMVISQRNMLTLRYETCQLHEIMRVVCLRKAKEENFVDIVDATNSPCNSRRIAVHRLDESSYPTGMMKNPKLRSLLFIQRDTTVGNQHKPWMASSLDFTRLQRLRALDLSYVKFKGGKLPSSIGKLIHLRYLSLYMAHVTHLPTSMRNLKLLLYLDLCLNVSSPIYIPNFLKEMRELVYLSLPVRIRDKVKLELSNLVNLERVENFSTKHINVKDLLQMTRLKKLSILFNGECSMETLSYSLRGLRHLENLTINGCTSDEEGFVLGLNNLRQLNLMIYMPRLLDEHPLPSHLTALSLCNCRLEHDPMPILEKLLQLKEVSLDSESFSGRRMVCSRGGFPQLHKLKFNGLKEWEEWIVEEGSMPLLHTLSIRYCYKLKRLPYELRFITSLKELRIGTSHLELKEKLSPGGEDYYKVQHIPLVLIE